MPDFNIDKRSVYFESLTQHPEYAKVLQQGRNLLYNKQIKLSDSKNDFGHKFDVALRVLKQGIEKQRAVEFQYIEQLKNKIPDGNEQLKKYLTKQLEDILNPEKFDYTALINFINTILLGQENYIGILKLEQTRGKQLEQVYNNMLKMFRQQGGTEIGQKNKKEGSSFSLKYGADDFDRFVEETYLDRHSFTNTEFSNLFRDVFPTIDYLLSEEINRAVKKIINNQQIWNQLSIKAGGTDLLINNLIQNLIKEISPKINTIIDEAMKKIQIKTTTDQLINDLIKNFDNSMKIDNKNFLKNSKKNFISVKENGEYEYSSNIANILLECKDIIQKLKTLEEKGQYQKGSNMIFDLLIDDNKEGLTLFDSLLQYINDYETNLQKRERSEEDERKILYSIRSKKGAFTHFIKNKIKNEIEKLTETTRTNARQAINTALNKITLTITGPELSEVIDTFIQDNINTKTFWTGSANKKADTMTFLLTWPIIDSSTTDKLTQQHIMTLVGQLPEAFMNEYMQQLSKKTDYVKTASEFSLRKGRDSFLMSSKHIIDDYTKKTSKNPLQSQLLKRFAESIRSSIVITETMKTFNQYNSKLGFIAGSMGPNVSKQVNNFAELFEKAGVPMTPTEVEWLEIALVNCSSAAIGYKIKDPIEKYLSVLAGFAIFDEGSLEIEMIVQETTNSMPPIPQIMHLYRLNGLYFPGSYILQRIYDRLESTISTELNKTAINSINDGVHIRATANETLINPNITNVSDSWADVYRKAQDSSITSIEVTFLSDLFNIVDQLFDTVTNKS